jgi:hypothetical protein
VQIDSNVPHEQVSLFGGGKMDSLTLPSYSTSKGPLTRRL